MADQMLHAESTERIGVEPDESVDIDLRVDATAAAGRQRDLVHARAVEATIWAMPAVSMAACRRSSKRDLGARYGDIIYFSDVLAPRHEFLTANHDTPYVITFLDLADGPVVVEVPPAADTAVLLGSAIDSWEVPLVDMGPSGEDAGKGGRYLFAPPGHEASGPDGDAPAGFIVVPSPTRFVHVALRPIAVRSGTRADAVAHAGQLRTYPRADADHPRANRYIDAHPRAWRTLPPFDAGYLDLLADAIDAEIPAPRDAAMLGLLASIGIEKGTPFRPDAERTALLTGAVRAGREHMADYFRNRAFVPFWPSSAWLTTDKRDTHGYTYQDDRTGLDYDRRAGGFTFWATWAPKRLADPARLPASFYLKSFRDHAGEPFEGGGLYRLRVPADTPARDFWSAAIYDVDTNAFIHNPQDRVGVSSYDREAMTVGADGSIEVYIGPEAPEGLAANWIPTAGRDWWMIFRFYGPEQRLFDHKWVLADLIRVG